MNGPSRSARRSAEIADLLAAARAGEEWAVRDLADDYLPRLSAFAAARGATDPDGIADVVLFTVLRRLDGLDFEAREQLWAYLCLTARSRIIDEHRAAKPLELVDDPLTLDRFRPTPTGADVFDDAIADRGYVAELLAPLTDEQRRVLELRFLDDLSVEETAARTGRSQGAVKGLQRRAINAILAAVAVAMVVLVVRGLGDGDPNEVDRDPASRTDDSDGVPDGDGEGGLGGDGDPENGADTIGDGTGAERAPDDGSTSADGRSSGSTVLDLDAEADPAADGTAENGGEGVDPALIVTQGTDRVGPALDLTGGPGIVAHHGVRIGCTVSHFSHSDPVNHPGRPGAAPATVHWGNTAVDAFTGSADLASVGNATCDPGILDRSAYAAPALFDAEDQVVLPEQIVIEYKNWFGPGIDRGVTRPIPVGLQLVAGPAVLGGDEGDRNVPVDDGEGRVRLDVLFPDCVAVDATGRPVLSSADGASHLAHPAPGGEANGCPSSHPYRIPQLGYVITYDVPYRSAWYLAGEDGRLGRGDPVSAWAVSAWDPATMDDVLTCVRDALQNCAFGTRGDLAERFVGPDGEAVYWSSVALDGDTDRTPYGTSFTAVFAAEGG